MQFKSLKSQIAVIFLTLILAIQVITFVAIKLSIDKNARLSVSQQLEVGERIFTNLLHHNRDSLQVGAKILAADFGFKAAIASNDTETIASAILNHQSRIGADIGILSSAFHDKLIISEELSHDDLSEQVKQVISNAENNPKKNDFIILNNQPYQLVAVPVKAPLTVGWIVMGFKINNDLALTLNKLSNLDVTFISKSDSGKWYSTASTMSAVKGAQILKLSLAKLSAGVTKTEMEVGGIDYGTRFVSVFNTKGQELIAVLQRSIDEATAPYQVLMLNILILSILGTLMFIVGIFYVSKIVTQPITELAETAKKLEEGDYSIHLENHREDELGKLSSAFDSMTTAIADREQSILKLAYWDEMTGLPNRSLFMRQLTDALQLSNITQEPLSVVVMNLDRFKQINNILGHEFGNKLLHAVALKLTEGLSKESDTVYRFSGDEYALLLPDTDAHAAMNVAKSICKILEKPIQIDEQYVDTSAGIGIASFPEHAHEVNQILSYAENAMHISKLKKSGPVIFRPEFDMSSNVNLTLASELKIAINNNQLRLFIQPKIDIRTRQVSSAEALIRWIHPNRGMIFPDQFIPFAEQSGLIRDISLWMIAEAAKTQATWLMNNVDIPIAVNISARDLIDSDLANKITIILNTHQVKNNSITLEVTESSIMDDPQRSKLTLLSLANIGIKLSIDDFGTGYSSLAYLKELPVSELKIDKSFVMHIQKNENDRIIVNSTIELAHNMGLQVVAEGIENIDTWSLLNDMGCDYGQGYYITKPMPVSDFDSWLITWH
ncbi:MAG TPA: EAL domain-containing protein [Methylotenera sp.]